MEEMLNENCDRVKTSLNQVKEWAEIVRPNVLRWEDQGELNLQFAETSYLSAILCLNIVTVSFYSFLMISE